MIAVDYNAKTGEIKQRIIDETSPEEIKRKEDQAKLKLKIEFDVYAEANLRLLLLDIRDNWDKYFDDPNPIVEDYKIKKAEYEDKIKAKG